MTELKECVPSFAFADDGVRVFNFPQYCVFFLRPSDPSGPSEESKWFLYVRIRPNDGLWACLPTELRQQKDVLQRMYVAYESDGSIVAHQQVWLQMASLLEQYFAGEDVMQGASMCEGVCMNNLTDCLYQGTGAEYWGSTQKRLQQELEAKN